MGNKLDYVVSVMGGAYKYGRDIKLSVKIKDYPKLETIIVPNENIPKKQEYILETYSSDLSHKYSDNVKVVGIAEIIIDDFLQKLTKGEIR